MLHSYFFETIFNVRKDSFLLFFLLLFNCSAAALEQTLPLDAPTELKSEAIMIDLKGQVENYGGKHRTQFIWKESTDNQSPIWTPVIRMWIEVDDTYQIGQVKEATFQKIAGAAAGKSTYVIDSLNDVDVITLKKGGNLETNILLQVSVSEMPIFIHKSCNVSSIGISGARRMKSSYLAMSCEGNRVYLFSPHPDTFEIRNDSTLDTVTKSSFFSALVITLPAHGKVAELQFNSDGAKFNIEVPELDSTSSAYWAGALYLGLVQYSERPFNIHLSETDLRAGISRRAPVFKTRFDYEANFQMAFLTLSNTPGITPAQFFAVDFTFHFKLPFRIIKQPLELIAGAHSQGMLVSDNSYGTTYYGGPLFGLESDFAFKGVLKLTFSPIQENFIGLSFKNVQLVVRGSYPYAQFAKHRELWLDLEYRNSSWANPERGLSLTEEIVGTSFRF